MTEIISDLNFLDQLNSDTQALLGYSGHGWKHNLRLSKCWSASIHITKPVLYFKSEESRYTGGEPATNPDGCWPKFRKKTTGTNRNKIEESILQFRNWFIILPTFNCHEGNWPHYKSNLERAYYFCRRQYQHILHEHSSQNQFCFSLASAFNIYTFTFSKDLCKIDFAERLPKNAHKPHHAS